MIAKATQAQIKRFGELERAIGRNLAFYCMCAVYNIPFYAPAEIGAETWEEYVEILSSENGTFLSGNTDVDYAIKGGIPDDERWAMVWGEGDEDNPYTDMDYRRLDQLFKTYSARLVSLGGYDAQQEDTLRNCCKMRLLADKCLAKGTKESVAMCTQLNKAIQTELSSEGLRKVDTVRQQEVRIDSIIDALERAGFLENGKILPLDDVVEICLRRLGTLGGAPSHKYPYTLDAADQMMFMIANNMYDNDDLPEIAELPDKLRFDRNVASEFAADANSTELEVYRRLGIGNMPEEPKPEKKAEPEEKTILEQMVNIDPDEDLQKEIMDMFFGAE